MPRESYRGINPNQESALGYPVQWKLVCTTAEGLRSAASGHGLLPDTRVPAGPPQVEGQIGEALSDYIVKFSKGIYEPALLKAGVEPDDSRILEIGVGFGRLAYGTMKNITPDIYVATDVFPELVDSLSKNRAAGSAKNRCWSGNSRSF